jgi:type II secretory pathway pseudopilin PulG
MRLLHTRRSASIEGFSLMELIVSLALITTIAASAFLVMPGMVKTARADSAAEAALNALRVARDRSIGERRNFELHFLGNNQIQTARVEIPGPTTTIVGNAYLENGQQFYRFPGLPDTPDLFGGTGAIAFGPSPVRMFTSEGTLVDSNGDVLNGTVFFGVPGDKNSARAITVFGATGLLQLWRWSGNTWVE